MKSSTLIPLLSLLGSTTASPSSRQQLRRTTPQIQLSHIPIPSIPGPFFTPSTSSSTKSKLLATTPESQLAGARLPSTNPILSVTSTFRIPFAEMTTTGPTAGLTSGVYQSSYWIGIDGLTPSSSSCAGHSLRVGIDTFWDTGDQSTAAWWEWYPHFGPEDFGNFSVRQGDVVRLTATADADGLGGEVRVEKLDGLSGCNNATTAVLATGAHRFDGVGEAGRLCLAEAEWVVEDYPILNRPDYPLPLANFSAVSFGEMKVNGEAVGGEGLETFDIYLEAQGGRLTDCEVQDGGLECRRVVGDV